MKKIIFIVAFVLIFLYGCRHEQEYNVSAQVVSLSGSVKIVNVEFIATNCYANYGNAENRPSIEGAFWLGCTNVNTATSSDGFSEWVVSYKMFPINDGVGQ